MRIENVKVGILRDKVLNIIFEDQYECGDIPVEGKNVMELHNGKVVWLGSEYSDLMFVPKNRTSTFSIEDVVIGIDFHWERKESQTFRGALKVVVEDDMLRAINILPVEEYLVSVISSEMKSSASLEFLKAHAVIARSWLLSQKNVHKGFHVCADDHCQRYQGIGRVQSENVRKAIEATRGEVLMYKGQICDARYSKCCGGMLEEFETCWEDEHHPYLISKRDATDACLIPNLTDEDVAREWIMNGEDSFCNTQDKGVLNQVLNEYDQETADFFRWTVTYSRNDLTELVNRKINDDLGEIEDLIPMKRGKSGRIYELKVVGKKKSVVVGKELDIRRILSESHLKSSAFVVDKDTDTITLHGAGWGHGVGLCQIGAAVMGAKGYRYNEILCHYYPNTELKKIYD